MIMGAFPPLLLLFFVLITLAQQWDPTGIYFIVGLVGVTFAVTFYFYWTEKRVEFYDSFVRLFHRRAKIVIDKKYSELNIAWDVTRGGLTRCILTPIDDDVEVSKKGRRRTWRINDVNGKRMDKPLFMWLQSKTKI